MVLQGEAHAVPEATLLVLQMTDEKQFTAPDSIVQLYGLRNKQSSAHRCAQVGTRPLGN